ncbi:MAG: YdcF family protein [Ferrovibrio sp.]
MLGSAALIAIGAIGALPMHDWLLRPLEEYFPVPELLGHVDGIIVLGGAEEPEIMAVRGWPELNSNADRLIGFVSLARQYPDAKLVFTGGAAITREDRQVSEADVAAAVFAKLGLAPERVIYERASRNTAENAQLSHALVQPQPGEVWVLVTSARHMPRAVATFRAVGWPMIPYPVDFVTGKSVAFEFTPLRRLSGFNAIAKEWLGLMAYRVLGRSAELMPAQTPTAAKP